MWNPLEQASNEAVINLHLEDEVLQLILQERQEVERLLMLHFVIMDHGETEAGHIFLTTLQRFKIIQPQQTDPMITANHVNFIEEHLPVM